MKGLDPQWNGKSEPQCDRRSGLIVADGVIAGALAGATLSALIQSGEGMDDTQKDAALVVAAGFAVTSIIFIISASSGATRRRACLAADQKWAQQRALDLETEPRVARTSTSAPTGAATTSPASPSPGPVVSNAAPASAPPATNTPPATSVSATAPALVPSPAVASFFCTSSASRAALNLCLADHPACEHARQVLSNDDLSPCTASRTAFCFDSAGKSRCFGTPEACATQRSKAAAAASATECGERAR